MNGLNRFRYILIIIFAVLTAGTTAYLALFPDIGKGIAVFLGLVILLMSSALMNLCIAGTSDDTRRIALLVFSVGVMFLFLGGIAFILFSNSYGDEGPVETEIHDKQIDVIESPNINDNDAKEKSYTSPITIEHETSKSENIIEKSIVPSSPSLSFEIIETVPDEIIVTMPEYEIPVIKTEEKDSISSIAKEEFASEIIKSEINTEDVSDVISDVGISDTSAEPYISPSQQRADEFWSSFFIAGEDEFVLEDGVYFMTLVVNNSEVGTINTIIEDGLASVSSFELKEYLNGSITDEAESRIFYDDKDYISIDNLNEAGVQASFDSNSYTITLRFSNNDMPVQILSVRGVSRGSLKSLPISGAEIINPATFTWSSRYTLSGNFDIIPAEAFTNSLNFTFSVDNRLRLWGLFLDFDYALRYRNGELKFDWGNYEFHYDFEDSMTRLSWGNVSADLLSPSGTDIGIRFDKAIEYGSPDAARKSHIEQIISIETESDVQIFNEDNEIFRRTLQPGNYRLQDFVLYTGVNKIRIVITPLNGSPTTETEIDLIYSSSLLAPGEIYYGGSLVTSRNIVNSQSNIVPGAVRIPLSDGRSLEYDARNISIGGYIRAGITESLTMDVSAAFMNNVTSSSFFNPSARTAFEFTHANILGTTRYNFNITGNNDGKGHFVLPEIYARVGHQVFTGLRGLSSLNLGFTYEADFSRPNNRHSIMLSSSFSGSLGIVGWGLSLSGTLRPEVIENSTYSASLSLSLAATRNMYFSAGLSLSGSGMSAPNVIGRASATIRFSPGRASVSISNNRLSADVNVNSGKHSFAAGIDTSPEYIAQFDSYSVDADYSYSGNVFNISAGLYADDVFRSISGNFSISTASVFADGLMGFSSYIPSNYILLKQEGALNGNDISVGSIGSSMSSPLNQRFGIGLYTGLSLNRTSSLSVYSVNPESFGSATTFNIAVPASRRGGYVLRVRAENKYSVSGVVTLPDGSLWLNGSSPVYSVEEKNGVIELDSSDYYVFTDSDGRFIISDLIPGCYAFDVRYQDEWLLYEFSVDDDEEYAMDIQILEKPEAEAGFVLPDIYSALYSFDNGEYVTGDEFWAMLYPNLWEAV